MPTKDGTPTTMSCLEGVLTDEPRLDGVARALPKSVGGSPQTGNKFGAWLVRKFGRRRAHKARTSARIQAIAAKRKEMPTAQSDVEGTSRPQATHKSTARRGSRPWSAPRSGDVSRRALWLLELSRTTEQQCGPASPGSADSPAEAAPLENSQCPHMAVPSTRARSTPIGAGTIKMDFPTRRNAGRIRAAFFARPWRR